MRIKSIFSHSAQAVAEGALVSLLVVGLLAGTAFAAKGGGGGGGHGKPGAGSTGSSTIAVVMVNDVNGDGLPNWGDTITFSISTTATSYPYVDLTCYQGGALVAGGSAGFYPSYPWPGSQNMPLKSPSWTSGAASCNAVLNTNLATLNFNVGA